MNNYAVILNFLLKTGVTLVSGVKELAPGCAYFLISDLVIYMGTGGEDENLACIAHECVHWIQIIYQENPLENIKEFEGSDPGKFNTSLSARRKLEILNHVMGTYPPELWCHEIPAYALESDPEKIVGIIKKLQEKIEKGELKLPKGVNFGYIENYKGNLKLPARPVRPARPALPVRPARPVRPVRPALPAHQALPAHPVPINPFFYIAPVVLLGVLASVVIYQIITGQILFALLLFAMVCLVAILGAGNS